jgi:hypothetical protein
MSVRQRLGKPIGHLIISGYKSHIKQFLLPMTSDDVIIDFDMFHSAMKYWIGGKISSAHIVTP